MRNLHQTKGIPIITYHSIDNSNSVISVSPEKFNSEMKYLKNIGYKSISIIEAVDIVKKRCVIPGKYLVITFDDGYKDNYTQAFKVLKQNNFVATIFLTTNFCGKKNSWMEQDSSISETEMLSWDEIKEMKDSNIDFGAHTKNHPKLSKITKERAIQEIVGSKKDIEKRIGNNVETFSYPFGDYNYEIREIVSKEFKAAISTKPGKISSQSDIYALERINAAGKIFKIIPFRLLSLGGFSLYLELKKIFDRFGKTATTTNKL